MSILTKANVKLSNGNMVHSQGVGVSLCHFTNCSIIYPVVPVYYFPSHPSKTISSGANNFFVGLKKFTSESLEHCDFDDPQGHYSRSTYEYKNIYSIFTQKFVKFNS